MNNFMELYAIIGLVLSVYIIIRGIEDDDPPPGGWIMIPVAVLLCVAIWPYILYSRYKS